MKTIHNIVWTDPFNRNLASKNVLDIKYDNTKQSTVQYFLKSVCKFNILAKSGTIVLNTNRRTAITTFFSEVELQHVERTSHGTISTSDI